MPKDQKTNRNENKNIKSQHRHQNIKTVVKTLRRRRRSSSISFSCSCTYHNHHHLSICSSVLHSTIYNPHRHRETETEFRVHVIYFEFWVLSKSVCNSLFKISGLLLCMRKKRRSGHITQLLHEIKLVLRGIL